MRHWIGAYVIRPTSMLVGPKELFIPVPHGVVRNFIVLAQLEESLTAVKIIGGIQSQIVGQQNL